LIFKGQAARSDFEALLATLRYLSLTSLAGPRWGPSRRALAVHFTSPDGWRVAALASDEVRALGEALAAATGLPLHDTGDQRDDFGPAPAVRMVEDVYGAWTRERARPLYLAPDRLLFGWRDAILLSTIRRLDVDEAGGGALLRVEHEASGGVESIGFMLDDAPAWAEAIAHRIDVPLQVTIGRKKKKRGD
jgi:hypothetical protein